MGKPKKREGKPGPAVYVSRGRSKHVLYKSARGSHSPALCGTSPHWSDPIGWRGSEEGEEKKKLEDLPWCSKCGPKVNHMSDLVSELPLALRIQLPTHTCPPAPVER